MLFVPQAMGWLRAMLMAAALAVLTFPGAAQPTPSSIEGLIVKGQWQEAARAIFREARSAYPMENSIATAQAKAGWVGDALETIADWPAVAQPGGWLSLVQEAQSLPPATAAQLMERAQHLAQQHPAFAARVLTQLAQLHADRGQEVQAKIAWDQALRTATEQRSYRQISEVLVYSSTQSPVWMLAQLMDQLPADTAGAAFIYRDLAKVALRHGDKPRALSLIQSGRLAVAGLETEAMRKLALQGLSELAAEAGDTRQAASSQAQALTAMRAGQLDQALTIATGLSRNLYVDHGQDLYQRLVTDALQRQDLASAAYLLEHPVRPVSWRQAGYWRQLAGLQVQAGMTHKAQASYQQARQLLLAHPTLMRTARDIEQMLALAAAMRQHGFEAQGQQTMLDTLALLQRIPERRIDEQVRAATLMAQALWQAGRYGEAGQQAARAYSGAQGYSSRPMEKARLLAGLGSALATFQTAADRRTIPKADPKPLQSTR